MTDKKISQLDAAATLTGAEMVEVVQNGVNVRTTAQAVANLAGAVTTTTYKYLYSFGVDGGGTGTLVLRQDNGALPSGFIIRTAWIDVLTILGSAGAATAALSTTQSAADIVAVTAFGSAPWASTGLKPCLPITQLPAGLKLTAQCSPVLVIAGAALNAGVFNLYVQGAPS